MSAAFLQQFDHSLGNATRVVSLDKPKVEHIRHNRDKHVRHTQIHFVEEAIQSRRLAEAELFERITDFPLRKKNPRSQPLLPPESGRSRINSCESPVLGDQASGQNDLQNVPETINVCHGSTESRAHPGTWRETSKLFIESKRVTIHGLVGNST